MGGIIVLWLVLAGMKYVMPVAEHHDYLIESVELLGSDEKTEYIRAKEALKIKLKGNIKNDLPICLKFVNLI